ncbi:hypothetical protein Tco_1210661 [Tanacetum coccineum]
MVEQNRVLADWYWGKIGKSSFLKVKDFVMSDSEDSTVTYMEVSSPFEDLHCCAILPTTNLQGYITESDREEDPEEDDEDPEEDPADYPDDRDDGEEEEIPLEMMLMIRQDTDEIYGRLDDAQDDRLLMSGQLNMLRRDRRAHARTARLIETKA